MGGFRWPSWFGQLLICGGVAAVFGQALSFGFVNWDDPGYIAENAEVLAGLSLDGVRWAFTSLQEGHWHPLTWLSHMAAVSAFGPDPAAHHAINVVLHAANALLLFHLLRITTGQPWAALFAALLFALHPTRAESVAWVTERKDVLSTFFWMGSTLFWLRFARAPKAIPYLLALGCFLLGLLTKPMVVTLPFTLLLLDYWPLGRWPARGATRLILEKLPFFALTAASAAITWYGQRFAGAMQSLEQASLAERCANAAISYLAYLGQWLWPVNLAAFYPMREPQPGLGLICSLLLLAITAAFFRIGRREPPLLVGWLWYLGTFVPVIGLVQVGGQSMADRFLYLPSMGLGLVLTWGWLALKRSNEFQERAKPLVSWAMALLVLVFFGSSAHSQVGHWRSSEALWTHTLSVIPNNFMAHNNLAVVLSKQGRGDEANHHASEAARLNPTYPPARVNNGNARARVGDYAGALRNYQAALERNPSSVVANYNAGLASSYLGNSEAAESYYRKTLEIDATYAMAHYSLGALLLRSSEPREGVEHLKEAARLRPGWQEPLDYLKSAGGL